MKENFKMRKKLALYYATDVSTKQMSQEKAKLMEADTLIEIREVQQRSAFNIMTSGMIEAMRGKKSEIEPIDADFNDYRTIIIFMPLWGGNPAPAMNSVIDLIPEGKEIELYMISAKGKSMKSADNTSNEIQKRGSLVTKYVDIKV